MPLLLPPMLPASLEDSLEGISRVSREVEVAAILRRGLLKWDAALPNV